jgi:hypothetical protein
MTSFAREGCLVGFAGERWLVVDSFCVQRVVKWWFESFSMYLMVNYMRGYSFSSFSHKNIYT